MSDGASGDAVRGRGGRGGFGFTGHVGLISYVVARLALYGLWVGMGFSTLLAQFSHVIRVCGLTGRAICEPELGSPNVEPSIRVTGLMDQYSLLSNYSYDVLEVISGPGSYTWALPQRLRSQLVSPFLGLWSWVLCLSSKRIEAL